MKKECIIVTGAQGDIATEIIAKLLNDGNNVIGITTHDVKDEHIEKIKSKISIHKKENISNYSIFKINVLDSSEIRQIIKKISMDYIIQTCIITHAKGEPKILLDASDKYIKEMLEVNLLSYIYIVREVISQMIKEDTDIKKDVIIISSVWGINGASTESIYSASKGGLEAFSKSIAKEYSKMNICINNIAPGYIDTKINNFSDVDKKEILSEIPLGRFGKTEDILEAIDYIRNSKYITGETLKITGGWYI